MKPAADVVETGTRKRVLFWIVGAFVLLAFTELVAFACGVYLQGKFKLYAVPVIQRSDRIKSYGDYLGHRDPQLGWPFSAEFGAETFTTLLAPAIVRRFRVRY